MEEENNWYLVGYVKCPKMWATSTGWKVKIIWKIESLSYET